MASTTTIKKPLVSVCVANYNGVGLIDDCLQSVISQSDRVSIEVIVHDDASTDGSAEFIRQHYPGIHLIESTENVGFCIANNRMVAKATGQFILLLNNDAALFPDALETLFTEADKLDSPAILSLPQYDWFSREILDRGSLLDPFLNSVPNLDENRADVGHVAGACMWLPKSLWDELGGFPAWFESIAEDLYLCCIARLAGHPVRTLSTSGYWHRVGTHFGGGLAREGRLRTTFRRRRLSERNRTFVLLLTYPTPFVQLLLPIHLMLLLFEGALLSVLRLQADYLTRIYLPVFPALLHYRHELMDMRRKANERRRCSYADYFSAFVFWPNKLRMFWRHGLPAVH